MKKTYPFFAVLIPFQISTSTSIHKKRRFALQRKTVEEAFLILTSCSNEFSKGGCMKWTRLERRHPNKSRTVPTFHGTKERGCPQNRTKKQTCRMTEKKASDESV